MKKFAVTIYSNGGWFGKVIRAKSSERAKHKFIAFLHRKAIYFLDTGICVEEV